MSTSGVLGVAGLGVFPLGGLLFTPPPPPPLLTGDARYRTKLFLEAYLNNENLTKDDGVTQVNFAVMYAYPPYPIVREFKAASYPVDLLFLIDFPTSEPLVAHARYNEAVPIIIYCIDKTGITGTKLKWTAERELRRIFEVNPWGSFRSIERIGDNDERLGSTTLYSTRVVINYRRTAVWS